VLLPVGRKILGRTGAALAVLLAMGVMASAASAAVVQKKPASSYQANGTVRVIIVVGNTTYLGGDFTAMTPPGGGTAVTRNHVAAINTTTGALLPWNPNASGSVYALTAVGSDVFLGGSFATVGGVAHKNLAEVDGTTGAVISTFTNALKPNKAVRALVETPAGNLYVGGAFTKPRPYLAEVNGTTGAYNPVWVPVVDQQVRALATDATGSTIVEGGFQQLAGHIAIGAVDPTTGAWLPFAYEGPVTPIFPGFPYRPFQVIAFAQDPSNPDMLFAGATGNGGTALALNIETGQLMYEEGFNGNVVGIGAADGVLYMGGHFSGYDGPVAGSNFTTPIASRDKLAAVDEATGLTLSPWNPAVNTDLGIEALAAGGTSLAIGGEFTKVAGVAQQHLALFHE
jgi:hypothetical protein